MNVNGDVHLTEVDYDPFATPELARAVPTTDAQRELWLADQLGREASLAFNESISLEISGPLQLQALQDSLLALSDRHESLRSTFSGDGMNMLIAPRGAVQAEVRDLSGLSELALAREIEARRDEAVRTPFDLVTGPLLRATLMRLGSDRHELILCAHHIVCDGWSFAVVARDLMRIYAGLCRGASADELPPAHSFGDYALGEHEAEYAAQVAADERYWVGVFDRGVPALDLPTDRPRRSLRGFSSRREDVRLEPAVVDAARRLGASCGASLFATLFGLFGALMARLGAEESGDVVIGVPSAGQAARDANDLVGHCVNLLPVRIAVDAREPVEALLRRASGAVLDAYDHQACTFGRLLSKLAIARDASRLPLVSVQFNVDSPLDPADLAAPGLSVMLRSNPRAFENFELFVNATQVGGAVVLECQYNTELFDAETVRRWLELYRQALERAAREPGHAVGDLFHASRDDQEMLAAFNATDAINVHRRIEALVSAQVARTPDAIALISGEQQVSYRDLDQRANAVASALAAQGVRAGHLVGMACGRNAHMLASMIGILKLGAAYVPLDPGFPAERLVYMCEDAALACVVTDASVTLPALGAARLVHADDLAPVEGCPWDAGDVEAPAYVIYTSGSTGKPKGVAVPHRAVSNFLASMAREPGLGADDRLVAVTTTSFDIAVLELFLPLTVGARVILADRETVLDGLRLRALIERHAATVLQATPSGWRVLIDSGWAGHARFKALVGGEALGEDLAQQLLERTGETWNMYGPTETTVWSTCWRVPRVRDGIRIGTPIANTQVQVLDERGRPCPIGVPGEIYIGGDGVAIGYLNRPELTAERFVVDPAGPGRRIYRTGDRGRWRNDGTLEHLGRLDFQVKVRGYRIELGEIEAVLVRHPDVAQAVVLVREDDPGDPRLVGYLVARGDRLDVGDVREFARGFLPEYMLPAHLMVLPEIPLLPNGKIHRKALPRPTVEAASRAPAAAPTTATEATVLEAMEGVLNLRGLGIDDDFFALGGHSLLASRLSARLNKTFGTALPLRTVFEAASARRLAQAVEAGRGESARPAGPALVHVADQTEGPLTVMQERIRFMEEMHPGRVVYNTPSAHRLTGPLDRGALESALRQMVSRQPSLRSYIGQGAGGAVLKVLPEVGFELPFEDLSTLSGSDREAALMRRLQAVVDRPIPLGEAPLFRVALYRLAQEEHVLLFMAHHIVWDGWSFDLFYQEMSAAYAAALDGAQSPLPLPPVSYVDYSHWHQAWMRSEACEAQVRYWRDRYAGIETPRPLPTDRVRGPGMTGVGAVEWVHVDKPLTERLREIAQAQGTTLNMLILSVYAAMMSQAIGGRSIVVGVPVRGRSQVETETVMGFFNNLLPLHLDVDPAAALPGWLAVVKRELLQAFVHQDVPFERLANEPELARHAGKAGLYQTLFSFQDARDRERHWGPLAHSSVLVMQRGATEDFSLWLMEVPAGLEGGFNFNADLFDAATVRIFRERLIGLLRAVAEQPNLRVGDLLKIGGAADAAFGDWLRRRSAVQAPAIAAPVRQVTLEGAQLRLAQLWSDLLGVPTSDIHPDDNFFDLGGNSLLAMRALEDGRRLLNLQIEPRRYAVESLGQLAGSSTGDAAPAGKVHEVGGLWAELLGIDAADIHPQDNFFDLGGSSLLAMRFVELAERRLSLRVAPASLVASSLEAIVAGAAQVQEAESMAQVEPSSTGAGGGFLSRVLRKTGWVGRRQ